MINTYCKNCIFENVDGKECFFDLTEVLGDKKTIYKKDHSNYIENYGCRYCLSQEMYDEIKNSDECKNIDIIKIIVDKAKLKYYLVVNLNNYVSKINGVCDTILRLDNRPDFISFINYDKDHGKELSEQINNILCDKNIQWKLHNMLLELSLQESMTIAMDTNFAKTNLGVFYVYDPNISGIDNNILNNRINHIHTIAIIEQKPFHAFLGSTENLDGLSMSFHGFKFMILNKDRNILSAIKNEPDFIYLTYES